MAGYYFPAGYQPNYYGGMYNPQPNIPQVPTPAQQPQSFYQQQSQQSAIQQNGILSVRSLDEVYPWPIAPGNSLTFYVESNPPVIATKTKGFSQLENPIVEVFDLKKRKNSNDSNNEADKKERAESYAMKKDVDALRMDFEAFKTGLKSSFGIPKEKVSKEAKDE